MTTEKKQVKLDEVINHVSYKCGLSRSMSRRVLQELIDFICLNLYLNKDNVVFLPRLGFFCLEEDKGKKNIKYQSSSYIQNLLNASLDDLAEAKEEYRAYYDESLQENLNGLSSLLEEGKSNLKPGATAISINRPKNTPDIVRSSFINYLQEEFIYGVDWIHPVTEQVFKKEQVQKALTVYKEYAPKLYNALRMLWVSQYNRANIARHFNVSSSSIRRSWNRAIDGIMLVMLYPELDPGVCIRIYNSRR